MYIRFAGCLSVSVRLRRPSRGKPPGASVRFRCSYHFTCRLRDDDDDDADRLAGHVETAEQFGERCKRYRSRCLCVLFLCVI